MTLLQMKVIVLTAELGSISAAARKLEISQPNASNCIKLCEEEVGFQIFQREKNGITITQKGEMLARHAKLILEEDDKIHNLKNHDDYFRLKIGSLNHHLMFEPFLKLVKEHQGDNYIDACYHNLSVDEGIEALTNHTIDLVVVPCLPSQIGPVKTACLKNNIASKWLCDIPSCVIVRKGHPAALDKSCENLSPGSSALKDFPYVAYRNFHEDNLDTNYRDNTFVQSKFTIYIDDAESRHKLLASTDAFALGVQQPKDYLDSLGLTSFTIPGFPLMVMALTRESDVWHKEVDEYLDMLIKEFEAIKIK